MTTKTSIIAEQIMATFSHPNEWRTPRGIAQQMGLPYEDVRSYLISHVELFERSPIQLLGEWLYRSKQYDQDDLDWLNAFKAQPLSGWRGAFYGFLFGIGLSVLIVVLLHSANII